MPKVYVVGNFQTGATSETQILPVVKGSDEITLNINNEDFATLQVSKRDLPDPAAWKTYLKPIYTMVTAIDTDKAWNAEGAILFSGFIKEVKMGVKETINIQVAGMREYASMRQPTNVYSGNVTDPEAGVTFQGSTDQHLMIAMMRDIWNSYSQGSTVPRPPTTIGTPSVSPNTGTKQYKTKNSEFLYTSDYLDDLRDNISLNGNEYRYVPRWASSAKNTIVWDQIVGTDAAPQINLATQTFNVNLDNNDFVTGASNSLTSTDYATRLIGVSIIGDEETPSDMRIITSGEPNTILVDSQFNPQVELSSALLDSQMSARINFMKKVQESGEVMVVRNASEQWITRVGGTVVMSAGGTNPDTSGLNISTRLVETKFNLSDTTVKTMIMSFKPKYGKLPNSPTNPNKFPNPGGGGFTPPIIPKLPDNVPTPGGGGGPVIPTIPDFETPDPDFGETESIFNAWQTNTVNNGSSSCNFFQYGDNITYLNKDYQGFGEVVDAFTVADVVVKRMTVTESTVQNPPTTLGSLPGTLIQSNLSNYTPVIDTLGVLGDKHFITTQHFVINNKVYIYVTHIHWVSLQPDFTQVFRWGLQAKSYVYSGQIVGNTISSWALEPWNFELGNDVIAPNNDALVVFGRNNEMIGMFGAFKYPKNYFVFSSDKQPQDGWAAYCYYQTAFYKNMNDSSSIVSVAQAPFIDAGWSGTRTFSSRLNYITAGGNNSGVMFYNAISASQLRIQQGFFVAGTSEKLDSFQQTYQIKNISGGDDGPSAQDRSDLWRTRKGIAKVGSWYVMGQGNNKLLRTKPGFDAGVSGPPPAGGSIYSNRAFNVLFYAGSSTGSSIIGLPGYAPGGATTTSVSRQRLFGYGNTVIFLSEDGNNIDVSRATLKSEYI